jgi:hypothetical protein
MTRRTRVTQAEIARAVRAAGPGRVVEVLPNGTHRLVPDDGKSPALNDIGAAKDARDVVAERLR